MYYFASDIHLGLNVGSETAVRERLLVEWLERVSADAEAIFILGDLFDFWYEYRRVVPKGFTRLLGKLSELHDRGIAVHFFPGNHDMWIYGYLHEECGVTLHEAPYESFTLYGHRVVMGHGDAVGPRGAVQQLLGSVFRSPVTRFLFSHLLHPDLAMGFGHRWSRSNRTSRPIKHTFRGEQEPIVRFARDYNAATPTDLFVFGHIHCAELCSLEENCRIAFLGEWMENPTYGVLSPEGFTLKTVVTPSAADLPDQREVSQTYP